MILVIGAGPAGCAAAIALRRRGLDVTLVDRARFPRDKVCGDVLLPGALESLRALGLPAEELHAIGHACPGGRYHSPRGRTFQGPFRTRGGEARPWLIVRRRLFDHWLLQRAREAGATVREGTEVTGPLLDTTGAGRGVSIREGARTARIDSLALVAADGASSLLAQRLGVALPERVNRPRRPALLAVAARGYARGLAPGDSFVEIHTSRETLPGCAWIVPTGAAEANVGVGFLHGRGEAETPARLLERLREQLPALRARLGGARIEGLRGWSLPLASQRRRLAGDGWLLAGDAAAMIDPLTGHGIHNALEAGRLAGETLADAALAGDFSVSRMRPYEEAARSGFLREALAGEPLQRALSRPVFAELLAVLGAWPPARGRLLGLIGHAQPRAELAPLGTLRVA
jgi:geranylgeranyl reductase family protein